MKDKKKFVKFKQPLVEIFQENQNEIISISHDEPQDNVVSCSDEEKDFHDCVHRWEKLSQVSPKKLSIRIKIPSNHFEGNQEDKEDNSNIIEVLQSIWKKWIKYIQERRKMKIWRLFWKEIKTRYFSFPVLCEIIMNKWRLYTKIRVQKSGILNHVISLSRQKTLILLFGRWKWCARKRQELLKRTKKTIVYYYNKKDHPSINCIEGNPKEANENIIDNDSKIKRTKVLKNIIIRKIQHNLRLYLERWSLWKIQIEIEQLQKEIHLTYKSIHPLRSFLDQWKEWILNKTLYKLSKENVLKHESINHSIKRFIELNQKENDNIILQIYFLQFKMRIKIENKIKGFEKKRKGKMVQLIFNLWKIWNAFRQKKRRKYFLHYGIDRWLKYQRNTRCKRKWKTACFHYNSILLHKYFYPFKSIFNYLKIKKKKKEEKLLHYRNEIFYCWKDVMQSHCQLVYSFYVYWVETLPKKKHFYNWKNFIPIRKQQKKCLIRRNFFRWKYENIKWLKIKRTLLQYFDVWYVHITRKKLLMEKVIWICENFIFKIYFNKWRKDSTIQQSSLNQAKNSNEIGRIYSESSKDVIPQLHSSIHWIEPPTDTIEAICSNTRSIHSVQYQKKTNNMILVWK